MPLGVLTATASSASAHHEQSCTWYPEYVQVQVGTRIVPVMRVFPVPSLLPVWYEDKEVIPVYETRKTMVKSCTTINHPPVYSQQDRFRDCVSAVVAPGGMSQMFWNDIGVIACLLTSDD
ncbi:hypothetical protein [Candidatus Poriferisodalis sp.]|uniref:hypothetical protein n=1 Tax=Candidatus Poriferisodalis sp. TaxID=3101277 RepID=UPI003B025EC1